MANDFADTLVGVMMVPLCLLGLLLASRAEDAEMYLFGLSLAGFSVAFGMNVLKTYLDHADAARVPVLSGGADD